MTSSALLQKQNHQAADLIRNARNILLFYGAGTVSPERGTAYLNALSLNQLCAKTSDESRTYWADQAKKQASKETTRTHIAIRKLQLHRPATQLVSQSTDGLLVKAGCTDVLELHGRVTSLACGGDPSHKAFALGRCLQCFSKVGPAVRSFEEPYAAKVMDMLQLPLGSTDLLLLVHDATPQALATSLIARALQQSAKVVYVGPAEPSQPPYPGVLHLQGLPEDILPLLAVLAFDLPVSRRESRIG